MLLVHTPVNTAGVLSNPPEVMSVSRKTSTHRSGKVKAVNLHHKLDHRLYRPAKGTFLARVAEMFGGDIADFCRDELSEISDLVRLAFEDAVETLKLAFAHFGLPWFSGVFEVEPSIEDDDELSPVYTLQEQLV